MVRETQEAIRLIAEDLIDMGYSRDPKPVQRMELLAMGRRLAALVADATRLENARQVLEEAFILASAEVPTK